MRWGVGHSSPIPGRARFRRPPEPGRSGTSRHPRPGSGHPHQPTHRTSSLAIAPVAASGALPSPGSPHASGVRPPTRVFARRTGEILGVDQLQECGILGQVHVIQLVDGGAQFETAVLSANADARRVVLFSVGSGGNPERHLPLLTRLAGHGCTVIAPHFERLMSTRPKAEDLTCRARRLRLALDAVAPDARAVAGVGHSIGATVLLALAGGQMWFEDTRRLMVDPIERLDRLALLAPATQFFAAPGALDRVTAPVLAWVGTEDAITPPEQCTTIAGALAGRTPVRIHTAVGAGHFSFMDQLPPGVEDELHDRDRFLAEMSEAVSSFVLNGARHADGSSA